MSDRLHRNRTLWLCTVLHAFTHIYHVALIPLYLLIRSDFKLESDGQVTFLVTVMAVAYFLPSYPMGVLADRVSRKKLLALGLAINGAGFVGLAFAPNYQAAILCLLLAGFGGSFYHPAATGLVAGLFPEATGKALGKVGMGAAVGFFFAPLYAGWRGEVAGWRAPVLELGLLGLVGAGLFYWMAKEHPAPRRAAAGASGSSGRIFKHPWFWLFLVAASIAFSLRDFAGSGMASLSSLFMQRAHEFSAKDTGLALSAMFLAAIISNPLFGSLSDRGRKRWTTFLLAAAALCIFSMPRVPAQWVVPLLAVYGFFFMASYPVIEAALMEAVHDSVRGRVFGFFITIGGLVGNLSHWLVGEWVRVLGPGASEPMAYTRIYGLLGILVLISILGIACLHMIRQREPAMLDEKMAMPKIP